MAKTAKNANPMSRDELLVLQNDVTEVGLQDVHLGRVLDSLLSHLARLNNLDYPVVVEAPAESTPAEAATPAAEAPVEQAPSQEGV